MIKILKLKYQYWRKINIGNNHKLIVYKYPVFEKRKYLVSSSIVNILVKIFIKIYFVKIKIIEAPKIIRKNNILDSSFFVKRKVSVKENIIKLKVKISVWKGENIDGFFSALFSINPWEKKAIVYPKSNWGLYSFIKAISKKLITKTKVIQSLDIKLRLITSIVR